MADARPAEPTEPVAGAPACAAGRLGCVSYLNAKPLIHGLGSDHDPTGPRITLDVPANLLADLEAGLVDLALCPVIDYHRASIPMQIVPVGGIGCAGTTMTVRLFSRVPIDRITTLWADTDSHSSVALVQVLLWHLHRLRPRLIDLDAGNRQQRRQQPEAMLLIGDKVVTDSPSGATYPHQLDLGEAWWHLTGLPFVFAVWMARADADLGTLPTVLDAHRRRLATDLTALADQYAGPLGWPVDLARRYLGQVLHYDIGEAELAAMRRFAAMAHDLGLLPEVRPLTLWSPEA